ncbi:MAG TPA: transglutaminase-like domain-containing protein [Methylomirabilota bacterium]|nr:transglutaminase-like domain-containing protein [Methylomirabilota bacterium]
MPPLLLGAALVFWGWQTGLLIPGLAMAVALEARGLVGSRWDLTRADFNRASDLSAVLLVLMAVYQAIANESARAVTGVIKWLPLIVFPLIACQLYSVVGRVETAVFFWSLRRSPGTFPAVDLAPSYFGLCLLAASTGNARATFYAGLVLLLALALWRVRAPAGALRWGAALLVAVALGWVGHVGLAAGQQALERRAQALFLSWLRRGDVDPYRSTTALGDLGELKLSDRVVLRVERGSGARMPMRLRQASYNVYHAPSWVAVDAAFQRVQPEADGATWLLRRDRDPDGRLTIAAYLTRGRGLLPLPNGAARVDDLMVVSLAQNRLRAVRVEEGLGLVTYTAHFRPAGADESPPTAADLLVPPGEAATLARVADEAGLRGRPPARAVDALRAFFLGRFAYTRYLGGARPGRSALEDFLLRSRRGHCEYFATATVLLLREAGIPARYAVGYAAHEWSRLERRWLVRASDAHAWALVWIDGAWVEVDTTPPDWVAAESGGGGSLKPLADAWEWVTFLFSRWRWSERQDRLTGSLGWLLIPLSALLVWRLWARRRVGVATAPTVTRARGPRAGDDSEFYAVTRRLAELGFARAPGEPLPRWLAAVGEAAPAGVATGPLAPLLALHYRHRFDPAGLSPAERRRLRYQCEAWLAAHASAPASPSAAAP